MKSNEFVTEGPLDKLTASFKGRSNRNKEKQYNVAAANDIKKKYDQQVARTGREDFPAFIQRAFGLPEKPEFGDPKRYESDSDKLKIIGDYYQDFQARKAGLMPQLAHASSPMHPGAPQKDIEVQAPTGKFTYNSMNRTWTDFNGRQVTNHHDMDILNQMANQQAQAQPQVQAQPAQAQPQAQAKPAPQQVQSSGSAPLDSNQAAAALGTLDQQTSATQATQPDQQTNVSRDELAAAKKVLQGLQLKRTGNQQTDTLLQALGVQLT